MNKFNRELKPGERVFRASLGPFITYCGLAVVSVIVIGLLGIFAVVAFFSSADTETAVWLVFAGMIAFLIACSIVGVVLAYRYQFGVIIDNDTISLNQRPEGVSIRWDEIAEIYRDKSWFGPYQPITDAGKEARAKKSWKEKTTGVCLSLIGEDGNVLGRIHSSQNKEFATLANIVETTTTQIQGHPTRDLDKERERALKKFKRMTIFNIVLGTGVLVCCLVYFDYTKRWDETTQLLAASGVATTAMLTEQEPFGKETTKIKYEFHDQSGVSHKESRRVVRKEWEKFKYTDTVEILYDPANSTTNRPAHVPVDSFFSDKFIRGFILYGLPIFWIPCLFFSLYQLLTSNYHYETDRYTIVKLGKPKT
jgi:hypothetical protein